MSKEAMKLALEALEKCDFALAEELAAWDIDPPLHHVLEASNACGPAITAIREALTEQPAQPQQKPAAYRNRLNSGSYAYCNTAQFFDNAEPLYTSPPAQRTWVGLTDEEITDIWAEASPYYHEDDFARAIEAKLKEKNA